MDIQQLSAAEADDVHRRREISPGRRLWTGWRPEKAPRRSSRQRALIGRLLSSTQLTPISRGSR
jgi:hypothetical protein